MLLQDKSCFHQFLVLCILGSFQRISFSTISRYDNSFKAIHLYRRIVKRHRRLWKDISGKQVLFCYLEIFTSSRLANSYHMRYFCFFEVRNISGWYIRIRTTQLTNNITNQNMKLFSILDRYNILILYTNLRSSIVV